MFLCNIPTTVTKYVVLLLGGLSADLEFLYSIKFIDTDLDRKPYEQVIFYILSLRMSSKAFKKSTGKRTVYLSLALFVFYMP